MGTRLVSAFSLSVAAAALAYAFCAAELPAAGREAPAAYRGVRDSDRAASVALPASQIAETILRPSVQVNAKNGAGGGTVIYSRQESDGIYVTFVLTAYHVVALAVQKDARGGVSCLPIEVCLYRADGALESRVAAKLVLWDEKKDAALLRLQTPNPCVAARLASRERLSEVRVFTGVYAIGCPLGHDPLPTFGEISTLRKMVHGERFWMMNAPTIYGNSGGGVFQRETLELIGMSAMICTLDTPANVPVAHMGVLLPLDVVYDWLAANGYRFVVDGTAPARSRSEW